MTSDLPTASQTGHLLFRKNNSSDKWDFVSDRGSISSEDSLRWIVTQRDLMESNFPNDFPWANIERLEISRFDPTDCDFSVLNRLENLRVFVARNSFLEDIHLGSIVTFPKLDEIDLSGSMVTSACASWLKLFQKLESLNLNSTAFGDRGFAELSEIQSLRSLRFAETKISSFAMTWIAKLVNLEQLEVSRFVADEGLLAINRHPSIKSLFLATSNIKEEGLIALSSIENLSFVALPSHISEEGYQFLARANQLEALWLSAQSLSQESFREIMALSNLKSLVLFSSLDYEKALMLQKLDNLTELFLFNNEQDVEVLGPLKEINSLEKITLFTPRVGEHNHYQLPIHESLKKLTLLDSRLCSYTVHKMRELHPNLDLELERRTYQPGKSLNNGSVFERKFSLNGVGEWTFCGKLIEAFSTSADTQLSVRSHSGGPVHLDHFPPHFLASITEIQCSDCNLDVTFYEPLKYSQNLVTLEIPNSKIDFPGLYSLLSLEALWRINLSRVQLNDQIFEKLAELKNLRQLILSGVQLTDSQLAGVSQLQLVFLDLRDCKLEKSQIELLREKMRGCEILH